MAVNGLKLFMPFKSKRLSCVWEPLQRNEQPTCCVVNEWEEEKSWIINEILIIQGKCWICRLTQTSLHTCRILNHNSQSYTCSLYRFPTWAIKEQHCCTINIRWWYGNVQFEIIKTRFRRTNLCFWLFAFFCLTTSLFWWKSTFHNVRTITITMILFVSGCSPKRASSEKLLCFRG